MSRCRAFPLPGGLVRLVGVDHYGQPVAVTLDPLDGLTVSADLQQTSLRVLAHHTCCDDRPPVDDSEAERAVS